jgi:hypothetical protein
MKDEFFEWFRAQDPDRFLSKELAAKDAWDYQQAKLQVAVDRIRVLEFHLSEIAESDLVASNLKSMARNAIKIKAK